MDAQFIQLYAFHLIYANELPDIITSIYLVSVCRSDIYLANGH